jgi:hypothetical protein
MADLFQLRALPLPFSQAAPHQAAPDAAPGSAGGSAAAPVSGAAAATIGEGWARDWGRCEELYYRVVLKLTQARARLFCHYYTTT